MAGRPPKPTALKVLHGNPGRRPLPKGEPKPELGIPTRPEWLSPEAKREWNRVVPELARIGLLAKIDRAMIAAYCQAWGVYVEAMRQLESADGSRMALTFETEKGYVGPNPRFGIAMKALEKAMQLSAKFGFTPSDRAKMAMPEVEEKDDLAEYLLRKANQRNG